jgi:DNA replicative helicase MCM subunit Mcm2 (Cdc46/Mcm family)
MVNKEGWDADELNKQNDLRKYLDALTRHQQQMIKGIVGRNAFKYLSLEEKDFLKQLQDSLTLNELGKLSKEENQFRKRLIEDTMAVWRRHKALLELDVRDQKQDEGEHDDKINKRWTPRHHDPPPIDRNKIYSVTEASRLHEGKVVSVMGVISGIQPMRKMIKGVSRKCFGCNQVYERKYDKPGLFESAFGIEQIRRCETCDTGNYLGPIKWENINAVIVELKDHNTFSEIDPLRIIVFGDDEPEFDSTRDIDKHIGETIVVTGDIFTIDISRRRSESKLVAYLYVIGLVNYLSRQDLELSAEDVKAIERFVAHVGADKVLEKLAEMFGKSIIGYIHVKKGLLLCAVSTSTDKNDKKINSILVGDPGLAKSLLLKEPTKVVPNSRYENVQFATGKSLTAIVTKEEGDALILRIGPIPQAKGAIVSLNEIEKMSPDDQGFLLDIMQEQEFTTNKFGQNFHVDAPTAIIASANPVGGSWKSGHDNDERINLDKIPMIKPLIDRFDLIFAFKDSRSKDTLTEYALKKSEMENRPTPDYTAYIAKHIMYAKQRHPKPRFSGEAKTMLNQYYVKIRLSYGSPRIWETIYRIAQNISKLKLKDTVDAVDAVETMEFYNVILQQLDMIVTLPSNPRDITYGECLKVLQESVFPISYEEVVKSACGRNPQVANYIILGNGNGSLKLRDNKKLRPVLEMLQNHSRVKVIRSRPVVLQYVNGEAEAEAETMVKTGNQACDQCDQCAFPPDTFAKNLDEKNRDPVGVLGPETESLSVDDACQQGGNGHKSSENKEKNIAAVSETRAHSIKVEVESPYKHLIQEEHLPNLGSTAYYCKEHPDVAYYDLEGIHKSHLDPVHGNGTIENDDQSEVRTT